MKTWLLAIGLVAVLGGIALGHAHYVRSEPANGAVVRQSPRVVRAWFSEELRATGSFMNVRDARGRLLASGGIDLDDVERRSMVVTLKLMTLGKYTVGWRTISVDDGDTSGGTFTFTVAAPK